MSCYIEDEIEKLNLGPAEKMLLSYYKYFTEKGSAKCCMLTNEELADRIGVSRASLLRSKKHLKDLGYIHTNGGIKVWFKGIKKSQIETPSKNQSQIDTIQSQIDTLQSQNDTLQSQNDTIQSQIETHNKKKEKKEKEKKGVGEEKFETNFELIFSNVKENFRTEENKTYLTDNFKDKVDYFNNMSKKDLNEDLGYIVDSFNSVLSVKLNNEARKNIEENKERYLIEKKKEIDFGEVF